MAELFEAVASWRTLVLVLLVFGFLPGTVLRLAVRCYPKGDPRRDELVNDLKVMKWSERPLWVTMQLETALHEGPSARLAERKVRRGVGKQSASEVKIPTTRSFVVRLVAAVGLIGLSIAALVHLGPPTWVLVVSVGLDLVLIGSATWIHVDLRRGSRLRGEKRHDY